MSFLKCCIYLAVCGIISFVAGRILPKNWFHYDRFPYRTYSFEEEGKLYDRLKVHVWQSKVPDMSRIFPKLMPAKNLEGDFRDRLPVMIQETCIAELIHLLLCFTGLYCLKIMPGVWGWVIVFIYIVFLNLPFIIIQRYNRPRLVRLCERMKPRH